ncbi:hypothetical protein [Streptomyces sp. NPDC127038]|uniref:hypothetical protein n=1 Tax=Streptomyces sp. NPDC127038 TaxID=3347114 RepID=UPI0036486F2C
MTTFSQTLTPAPTVELTFGQQHDAQERNDSAYRSTVLYRELPDSGHVAHQALSDRVLVTATDLDVIAEWLFVMGGKITTVDLPSGQTVWTLATRTWSDSPNFPVVPVFVTVVQATGAPVMHEIAAAVAR